MIPFIFHVIIDVGIFMLPNFAYPLGVIISGIFTLIIGIVITILWGPEKTTKFRIKNE